MILSKQASLAAQDFILAEEAKRRHLVVALSGAHAHGFPSKDSDIDLKAIHIAPTKTMLGLRPRSPAAQSLRVVDDIELDYSSNELGGVLIGILKGNGSYLERVLGPHLLHTTPEHEELEALTRASLARRAYRHYRGFAWQQRVELESMEAPTVGRLLSVLRTALTGIHLLRSGELVVDLMHNAEEHGYIDAMELVAAKRAGEQTLLSETQRETWFRRLNGLFQSLDDAVIHSPLPLESPNEADFEDWLMRKRLAELTRQG